MFAFKNYLRRSVPPRYHMAGDLTVLWLFSFALFLCKAWRIRLIYAAFRVVIDLQTAVVREIVACIFKSFSFVFHFVNGWHLRSNCFQIRAIRWGTASSRKTKITELDGAISLEQDVSWFDISMHHSCRMNEIDTAQNIVEYSFKMFFLIRSINSCFQYLLEIARVVFHYQKYLL